MSAENWSACIAFTLGEEGGLVDDPSDPGGLTNFGISQAAYPNLDIATLTRGEAEAIYRRDYWSPAACDKLPAGVDLMVFDMAVNAGVAQSGRILQRCIGAEADGMIGKLTLQAVADTDARVLVTAIGAAQRAFYESLPQWTEFGAGWGARCGRRTARAAHMVASAERVA